MLNFEFEDILLGENFCQGDILVTYVPLDIRNALIPLIFLIFFLRTHLKNLTFQLIRDPFNFRFIYAKIKEIKGNKNNTLKHALKEKKFEHIVITMK